MEWSPHFSHPPIPPSPCPSPYTQPQKMSQMGLLTPNEEWYSTIIDTNATGALVLLVWEYLITFDDEVNFIWCKPNRALVKWLFLFLRYFSLFAQIGNQVLSEKIASSVPVSASSCRMWYTWRLVAAQVMLVAVEVLLIIRVYALYNKSKRIVLCLLTLVLAEVACSATNSIINIPRLLFSPACSTVLELRPVIQFGIISICTQTSILFLTIAKQLFASRAGLGRTPIVSLMIRDGLLAFVVIFGMQHSPSTSTGVEDCMTVIY
ncbi:hypothetical protein FIBSPDRAFT_593255 [Athelia psychrophila]|uniref:DUF6533 domain-containing protein n=1 Tax=Athelia psychrophila TaxID=1759441 RepID=A0A166H5Q7_9AGAM|nr:hypothetical protein FIBSPDRAFT_593255 [Fibularhizoctonia sp. CBS 109695]